MSPTDKEKFTLTPADAAAADALLNGDSGGDPTRKQRLQAWLGVLDGSPMPEPAGDLASRTLAAVQADHMNLGQARRQDAASSRAAQRTPGAWRRRLAELGAMAIAATLLVAVSLVGLGTARASTKRVACQANLKQFAAGFVNYSSLGADGQLPLLAMPANGSWLRGNVAPDGTAAVSNAANLLPLVTRNLVPVKALFCAGAGIPEGPIAVAAGQMPAIGYSYRDVEAPAKPTWDGKYSTIIMADKNPVFGNLTRPELANNNSPNHEGKGSYVLRASSDVTWETSPNIGPDHDNIWTLNNGAQHLAAYSGREFPTSPADVFVCP